VILVGCSHSPGADRQSDVKTYRIYAHFYNRSGLAITNPWTSELIFPDETLEFTGYISKKG
jgi:hypothetical protein